MFHHLLEGQSGSLVACAAFIITLQLIENKMLTNLSSALSELRRNETGEAKSYRKEIALQTDNIFMTNNFPSLFF